MTDRKPTTKQIHAMLCDLIQEIEGRHPRAIHPHLLTQRYQGARSILVQLKQRSRAVDAIRDAMTFLRDEVSP